MLTYVLNWNVSDFYREFYFRLLTLVKRYKESITRMLDTPFVFIKCAESHSIILVNKKHRNKKSILAAVYSLSKFFFIALFMQNVFWMATEETLHIYKIAPKMSKFYQGSPPWNIAAKLFIYVTSPFPLFQCYFSAN